MKNEKAVCELTNEQIQYIIDVSRENPHASMECILAHMSVDLPSKGVINV